MNREESIAFLLECLDKIENADEEEVNRMVELFIEMENERSIKCLKK